MPDLLLFLFQLVIAIFLSGLAICVGILFLAAIIALIQGLYGWLFSQK